MTEGDRVRVRFTKWGGGAHWQYDAVVLGRDDFGTWLGHRSGQPLTRPGQDVRLEYDRVCAIPFGHIGFVGTFNAWTGDQPGPVDRRRRSQSAGCHTYVDITTVPMWAAHEVTMVDLDLDVVRGWTGEIGVEDRGEFAEHQVSLQYPPAVVAHAEHWCDEAVQLLQAGEPPFDGRAQQWQTVLATLPPT